MKTHQVWSMLTHVILELMGHFFTRACYYSYCSCNEVLVKNGVKLEELSSVWLSLFYIFGPPISLFWRIPWDLLLARIRNDAFQESFSHLWLPNFPFEIQPAPLYIIAKERWLEDIQPLWALFSDWSGFEIETVGVLILYKAVEVRVK